MQVVLYTNDMEAITVIDLPQWALDRLHDGQFIRVPVLSEPQFTAPTEPPTFAPPKCISIWAERFRRNGKETWLLFTNDDETALLLKSDVLPGQRKAFQDEYKRGFIAGIVRALS